MEKVSIFSIMLSVAYHLMIFCVVHLVDCMYVPRFFQFIESKVMSSHAFSPGYVLSSQLGGCFLPQYSVVMSGISLPCIILLSHFVVKIIQVIVGWSLP